MIGPEGRKSIDLFLSHAHLVAENWDLTPRLFRGETVMGTALPDRTSLGHIDILLTGHRLIGQVGPEGWPPDYGALIHGSHKTHFGDWRGRWVRSSRWLSSVNQVLPAVRQLSEKMGLETGLQLLKLLM